jgi:hypothetical protein
MVVSILASDWKLYQQFVFIYCRINSCIWLKTISAFCSHLLSYQFLYLSENDISNLCSFTAVSILLPDWKLYQPFVVIYCRINYCIWLKTISTLCVHLLSYQFLYLSENSISNLCSFTAVSIIVSDWKLYQSFVVIYGRINSCIWVKTVSVICVHLLPYQFLYLIENYISYLWSFTVVSILVSDWKLYKSFVFIYGRTNSCIWLKTVSAICVNLLPYQFLYLIESYISFLYSFTVVSVLVSDWKLYQLYVLICCRINSFCIQFLLLSVKRSVHE